jgi:hypothetical protein
MIDLCKIHNSYKFIIFLWKVELNRPTAKNLVTFGSISAKNADAGTMCQSCRDLWSFHQEILTETLSLGDITGNEIRRWSYPQCQISEKAALKVKVVVRVFSN